MSSLGLLRYQYDLVSDHNQGRKTMNLKSLNVNELFREYAKDHSTQGNLVTHWVGIPMIIIGLLGLLSMIEFAEFEIFGYPISINAALILLSLGIGVYLILDWRLGASFSLVLIMFYRLGHGIALPYHIALFLLGWVFQGIGHVVFEKRSPSFMMNLIHLFIGPFFIFSKLFGFILRGFH